MRCCCRSIARYCWLGLLQAINQGERLFDYAWQSPLCVKVSIELTIPTVSSSAQASIMEKRRLEEEVHQHEGLEVTAECIPRLLFEPSSSSSCSSTSMTFSSDVSSTRAVQHGSTYISITSELQSNAGIVLPPAHHKRERLSSHAVLPDTKCWMWPLD